MHTYLSFSQPDNFVAAFTNNERVYSFRQIFCPMTFDSSFFFLFYLIFSFSVWHCKKQNEATNKRYVAFRIP